MLTLLWKYFLPGQTYELRNVGVGFLSICLKFQTIGIHPGRLKSAGDVLTRALTFIGKKFGASPRTLFPINYSSLLFALGYSTFHYKLSLFTSFFGRFILNRIFEYQANPKRRNLVITLYFSFLKTPWRTALLFYLSVSVLLSHLHICTFKLGG